MSSRPQAFHLLVKSWTGLRDRSAAGFLQGEAHEVEKSTCVRLAAEDVAWKEVRSDFHSMRSSTIFGIMERGFYLIAFFLVMAKRTNRIVRSPIRRHRIASVGHMCTSFALPVSLLILGIMCGRWRCGQNAGVSRATGKKRCVRLCLKSTKMESLSACCCEI